MRKLLEKAGWEECGKFWFPPGPYYGFGYTMKEAVALLKVLPLKQMNRPFFMRTS